EFEDFIAAERARDPGFALAMQAPVPPHCVVIQSDPVERNGSAVATDICALAPAREALLTAAKAGRATVSRPFNPVPTGADSADVVLTYPVFAVDLASGPAARRVSGWVSLVIAIDDLARDLIPPDLPLSLSLVDEDAGRADETLLALGDLTAEGG